MPCGCIAVMLSSLSVWQPALLTVTVNNITYISNPYSAFVNLTFYVICSWLMSYDHIIDTGMHGTICASSYLLLFFLISTVSSWMPDIPNCFGSCNINFNTHLLTAITRIWLCYDWHSGKLSIETLFDFQFCDMGSHNSDCQNNFE